jgi:hypothetical protein
MTIDSASEARNLREKARKGELTEQELDKLIEHVNESPQKYATSVVTAICLAVHTGPKSYFDKARHLLFSLLRATIDTDNPELNPIFLQVANAVVSVEVKHQEIIDEKYISLVEDMEDTDSLQANVQSACMAGPIMLDEDRDYITFDRICQYFDICQDILYSTPRKKEHLFLITVLPLMKTAVKEIDSPEVVHEAVDRLDLIQLIGHSEPGVRTQSIELIEELARLNPEPLGLYVSPLITRLDEHTEQVQDRTDTSLGKEATPAERRAAASAALAWISDAHPNRCSPVADRFEKLLRDDELKVRIHTIDILSRLYEEGVEGVGSPTEFENDIMEAVETASKQQESSISLLDFVQGLIESEDTEKKKRTGGLIERDSS